MKYFFLIQHLLKQTEINKKKWISTKNEEFNEIMLNFRKFNFQNEAKKFIQGIASPNVPSPEQ